MVVRIIFLFLCGLAAILILLNSQEIQSNLPIAIAAGLGTALAGLLLEKPIRSVPTKVVIGGTVGFLGGVGTAGIMAWAAKSFLPATLTSGMPWIVFFMLLLGYLGLTVGMKGTDGTAAPNWPAGGAIGPGEPSNKILDTSVIIEGRIADLCETGFLEGSFIIPQFILQELQHIADSSDSLKRARGRRGLDVLHRIQKMVDIDVRIVDNDYAHIRNVDAKLVALGKEMNAKIITNDLNLNKVAELQGVQVLNINQLCNALKPVVLPGESMKVFILKEGKEVGQGVAYLDDGTMIVVDNARRLIGKNIDVIVTSVLQTTAGRMIFTRIKETTDKEKEELHAARG